MMKIQINQGTMENIMTVVRPLISDNYIRFDFGVEQAQGMNQMMVTKVTITSENDQAEMEFFTTIPAKLERPLSECSRENPLEKAVVPAKDFAAVVDALSAYKADFLAETDSTKILLSIEGIAEMPVNKVSDQLMKAVIPHRENSTQKELWDPDVIMIGLFAENFVNDLKPIASLKGEIEDGDFKFVNLALQDTEMKYMDAQDKDGNRIKRPYANAYLEAVGGNGYMFANCVVDVFSRKGCGKDILESVSDEVKAGIESPIISFEKGEDESYKAVAVPYKEFKEGYDKERGLVSESKPYDPENFQFAIPIDGVMKILSLAQADISSRISLVVGKKYIQATFSGLGCTYLTVQQPINKVSLCNQYESVQNRFKNDTYGRVTVDSKTMQNAIKLALIYEKDELVSNYPVELTVSKDSVIVVRDKARAVVPVLSTDTQIDSALIGMSPKILRNSLSGIPVGNVNFFYQAKQPIVIFTKGGDEFGLDKAGVLAVGVNNVEENKRKAKESYEKEKAEKKKKEGTK